MFKRLILRQFAFWVLDFLMEKLHSIYRRYQVARSWKKPGADHPGLRPPLLARRGVDHPGLGPPLLDRRGVDHQKKAIRERLLF